MNNHVQLKNVNLSVERSNKHISVCLYTVCVDAFLWMSYLFNLQQQTLHSCRQNETLTSIFVCVFFFLRYRCC